MKHKNISTRSGELLTHFNNQVKSCFTNSQVYDVFPQVSRSAIKELLSDMTKRGLLMRIKEGTYYIIPYERDPDTFLPDWHLLAEYLVKDADYYIGYYSALQIHNLITQPSLKEQIVVNRQIRPSTIEIKGIPFQFIYHNKSHFFGSKKTWVDNFNKVNCSDLEKTMVDCLFKPDYAGGIVEIARALYMVRDNLNFDTLLKYTFNFGSQAVIKRLGFLLELLEIYRPIIKDLNIKRTKSFVVLDTELPKEGKMISRWSIQQNIDTDTIKSAIYT